MLSIDIQLMYVIYIIHMIDKLETALMNCQPLSPSLSQQGNNFKCDFLTAHKSQQKAENRMFRVSAFYIYQEIKVTFCASRTNKQKSFVK